MAIELVTGYRGVDHVTAEQMADAYRSIVGDSAIAPVGNRMRVTVQTANQIIVQDGCCFIDGRQVIIPYGATEAIAITSGTPNTVRKDIVVLQYERDADTGVESAAFRVITGTPAASSAVDPAYSNVDIRTGVSTSQKPFARVNLQGTSITGIDMLMDVALSMSDIKSGNSPVMIMV